MIPTEIHIKAAALSPDIHDALTDRRRFNFKMSEGQLGSPASFFSARAEQAKEPGMIRIFDIQNERPLDD